MGQKVILTPNLSKGEDAVLAADFAPMLQITIFHFIALFVILDPVGTAAIFAGLTRGTSEKHRRTMAVRGVAIAGVTLLLFAFAGDFLLRALGIGLPAFRIAGGVLLFLLAIDMLFAHRLGFQNLTEAESKEADRAHDISVFPLAIPLIAGPGGLTTMVLLMGRAGGVLQAELLLIGVLIAVLGLTVMLLLGAARVVSILGETGVNVVTRVLGILLAALAAQYVLDGINEGVRLG